MIDRHRFAELQAFSAILDHGSFVRAAAHLGISPSSLSQVIRRLEDRLGTRLLHRTTRSVAPTESGQRLHARLVPLLEGLGEATVVAMSDGQRVAGRLRLNASRVAAVVHLAPILGDFLARYPDIVVEVVTDDRPIDVIAQGFDAGIRLGECLEQDMIAVRLTGDLVMKLVAAPAYLDAHEPIRRPHDLASHRCLAYRRPSDGSVYRWEFEMDGTSLEIDVSGPVVVDEPAMLTEIALSGVGVAYQFAHQVDDHLAAGRLVQLLPEWTPPFPGFYLYYADRRHVPAPLRALVDFVAGRRGRGA